MATSDILGLFTTPEQYKLAQDQAQQAQAIQYASLNPMAQANYGTFLAGQRLGGAIGGALGGEDPQLKLISQRQQILGMIDPSNPDSFAQGIQMALQTGDTQTAFLLRNEMMKAQQQAQQQEIRGFEREKFLLDRGLGMQQRGVLAGAKSIAEGLDPNTGEPFTLVGEQKIPLKPLFDPTTRTINEDVANTLISKYGQVGADIVKQRLEGVQGIESLQVQQLARTLFKEDGTRDPVVEKQLSTTVAGRKILNEFAPQTKELKKGEKLAERQPNGTWKVVPLEGIPTQTTTSDNAIQSLIAGKAIHPTVLPYAQQLARNFVNLDFEDQNVLMEKLTRINNDAQKYASEKDARAQSKETSNSLKELNIQLAELKLKEAQAKSLKAEDGKEIKFAEGTKLASQAAGVDKLVDLSETFKPSYAGYPTDAAGAVAVLVAGKLSDPESVDLFQWWQGYQDHVNKVRNELFGAALTAPEKAEFEKAMVTKGMSPTQAQANLKRQADIALKAYNKLEGVLRIQGYSKSALDILKPSGFRPPLSSSDLQKK
jgi:hypothetical protein